MSHINVWVALSAAAEIAIKTRLEWDEEKEGKYPYSVTDTEYKIFQTFADHVTVRRMFKPNRFIPIIGKTWNLYSLNLPASRKAKEAIDFIASKRGSDFVVLGAWDWEGNQVRNARGEVMYPLHEKLIQFMPDQIERDNEGNEISRTPASQLSDINLIQGQQPRQFT